MAVLAPPDTSGLDATLARHWAVRVWTGGGVPPSPTAVGWTFVLGLSAVDLQTPKTRQEAGDYHSGQDGAQIATERSWTLGLTTLRKLDAGGDPDDGLEFIRNHGTEIGADELIYVQVWRTDGLPDAWQGRAGVDWTSGGSDKTALQGATVNLTGYGKLNSISKPTTAAVSSIIVMPATATLAVGEYFRLGVKDNNGDDRTLECDFTTSNPARAVVAPNGVVTAVATGSAATITATLKGTALTDTAAVTVS